MDNNFVAIEKKVCPVCGITHSYNTETILISKYLKPIPEEAQITGYDLCEKDDNLHKDDYVALIVTDPEKSKIDTHTDSTDSITMENAYRTGEVVHIKRTILAKVLNTTLDENLPFVFIDPGFAEKLKSFAVDEN